MIARLWFRFAVGFMASAAFHLIHPAVGDAVDCVTFAALQNPSATELARLNIKLTFVDERTRVANSLVFRKSGSPVDIDPAAACHKSGIDYTADADQLETFGVTSTQLQAALDSLAAIPSLTDGGLDSLSCLAVVVMDSNGSSSRVFDSIIDESTARATILKLQQALATNDSAIAGLAAAACRFGIATLGLGTDVTSRVAVTFSGVRYRRSDSLYVVTAKVRNTSATILAGPAVLVVRFEGAVSPTAPDGFTACNANPPGTAFFRILGNSGSLSPNGSTTVVMTLSNPLKQNIRPLRLRVVSGVGG